MTKKNIASLGWQIGIGAAGAAILAFFLLIPTPRQFGLAFRYDFLQIIAFIGLIIFLIFQLPDKFSRFLLFALLASIFVWPIAGLWASGQSEQYLLGGIIPFSDARSYFIDSRRLSEGAQFITGASRRPLFTAMLTSIQWMTGQNLYITIAILTFVLTITVYLALREFRNHEGPVAGTLFLILVFCFIRLLLGKTLSEFIGLPLGLLSLVFFVRGASTKQLKYILFGLLLLSLALNARAGAFIVLPTIAIWTGWFFRQNRFFHWQSFLYACSAIVIGFIINLIVFQVYSSPESAPFGNFSYTIYGVARGGLGWTQIFTEHPETWEMPSDEQSRYIYSLTFDIIKRKPMNLVNGIISSYKMFFSMDDYYGSIGWFGGQGLVGNIARICLYFLFASGIFVCIKEFKKSINSFLLFAFLGIFLSISLVPPLDSNRMRAYAATIPFFVAIPGIGLSSLCSLLPWKFLSKQETQLQSLKPAYALSTILILLMTIIPLIPFKLNHLETRPNFECAVNLKSVSFRVLPGNFIKIIDQQSSDQDWVPEIREKTFANRVHNLPNWETFPLFTQIKPGQFVLADLDLQDMKAMILIGEWQKVSNKSGIQTVCARPSDDPMLKDYNVYFAEEYLPEQ